MTAGPTVIHPLPAGYMAATERYRPNTKLVELPGGGLTMSRYQGGIPFPNPTEPHRRWKLLADFWYRYIPRIVVNTPENPGFTCTLDGFTWRPPVPSPPPSQDHSEKHYEELALAARRPILYNAIAVNDMYPERLQVAV
jgi:hypothetical protein